MRNAIDAVSMVSTADGGLTEVSNMLQRMRELALQAANEATTANGREYSNKEYENLIAEIQRIANNTQLKGRAILQGDANAASGSNVKFQVGANGAQTIAANFGNVSQSGGAPWSTLHLSANAGAASFVSAANTSAALAQGAVALTHIDSAITAANLQKASFGAAVDHCFLMSSIIFLTLKSIPKRPEAG